MLIIELLNLYFRKIGPPISFWNLYLQTVFITSRTPITSCTQALPSQSSCIHIHSHRACRVAKSLLQKKRPSQYMSCWNLSVDCIHNFKYFYQQLHIGATFTIKLYSYSLPHLLVLASSNCKRKLLISYFQTFKICRVLGQQFRVTVNDTMTKQQADLQVQLSDRLNPSELSTT